MRSKFWTSWASSNSSRSSQRFPGVIGGDYQTTLFLRNLPEDLPDGTVTVDYTGQAYVKYKQLVGVSVGGGANVNNLWQETAPETTTPAAARTFPVPISNPGGGKSFAVLPPMRLGTFFMKL